MSQTNSGSPGKDPGPRVIAPTPHPRLTICLVQGADPIRGHPWSVLWSESRRSRHLRSDWRGADTQEYSRLVEARELEGFEGIHYHLRLGHKDPASLTHTP